MHISEIKNAWRVHWIQARFRDAIFYVEQEQRQSGRRVALHQYPKRNLPYAEDMGRAALQFTVQGYVIGKPALTRSAVSGGRGVAQPPTGPGVARDYLTMKFALIEALQQDGPGTLYVPMQHQHLPTEVMCMGYGVTESRERGGICMFNMQFCEYGSPTGRTTISTADELLKMSATVENVLMGALSGKSLEQVQAMVAPYTKVLQNLSSSSTGKITGI